jgi:hypothetical protein
MNGNAVAAFAAGGFDLSQIDWISVRYCIDWIILKRSFVKLVAVTSRTVVVFGVVVRGDTGDICSTMFETNLELNSLWVTRLLKPYSIHKQTRMMSAYNNATLNI